jgi:hypothetical protein
MKTPLSEKLGFGLGTFSRKTPKETDRFGSGVFGAMKALSLSMCVFHKSVLSYFVGGGCCTLISSSTSSRADEVGW